MVERVSVFVDGSNFYHGLKNNVGRIDVDFYKFAKKLVGPKRKLIRIYYYSALADTDTETGDKQKKFFEDLKNSTPYIQLIIGRLEKRGRGSDFHYVEKGVDINMAVDMLKYAYTDALDTCILVTGDGDFVPAVETIKDTGKQTENASFAESSSNALRQACDVTIDLNQKFLNGCYY